MNNSTIDSSIPSLAQGFPEPPQQIDPLGDLNFNQPFEKLERDLMHKVDYMEFTEQLNKLRTRWACITSKSQRAEKTNGDRIYYQINRYHNLVEVKPQYEKINGTAPPDRTGETIQRFTPRQRSRMMSKARKLNKNPLPVPYFITLTYHKNFQDCQAAKKHLNAFFQRWRRRGSDFAYIWKMEPQERGAVHFHIGFFPPKNYMIIDQNAEKGINPENWEFIIDQDSFSKGYPDQWAVSNNIGRVVTFREFQKQISREWAEVTRMVDGYDVPYTKIDYVRKTKKKPEMYRKTRQHYAMINTYCANPRIQYRVEPDPEHVAAGTNVRRCENWTMFLGYIYKYLGETVKYDPFPDNPNQKTGRFYGFSYNLDFEALQTGIVDQSELNKVNEFCNKINDAAYYDFLKHMKANKERARERYSNQPHKLRQKLIKISNSIESQKRRWVINKEKIKAGYMLQFQLNAKNSAKYYDDLDPLTTDEYFSANYWILKNP